MLSQQAGFGVTRVAYRTPERQAGPGPSAHMLSAPARRNHTNERAHLEPVGFEKRARVLAKAVVVIHDQDRMSHPRTVSPKRVVPHPGMP